jgi:O-antigen/teichoic acid export membrane protein
MSRSKRFITGTLAGYGNIAANIVFTIISVPLALLYLEKEQFGLWALASQLNGYLVLLELGMGIAINRHIADHKDDVDGGTYGVHLLTSGLVFLCQGIIITVAGFGISWIAPTIFSIPPHLAPDFKVLVMSLAAISGVSLALRSFGSPLWAFHRTDLINYCFSLTSLSFLGFLWLGFSQGLGVISFPLAQIPAVIGAPIFYFWICHRSSYYPKQGKWGRPCFKVFREIFRYGRDIFMIQIGQQLVNASHIMIISRFVGLGAAATYAIATKTYTMCMMLLANPLSSAAPALTELHVRNEKERFVRRYSELINISLATSALLAFGIAAGNRSFVDVWTDGRIEWPWQADLLLAVLLIIQNLNRSFLSIFSITKNLKPVRYSYLLEAVIFIPLSCLAATKFGIIGVLSISLIAHLLTTNLIAVSAAKSILGLDWMFLFRICFAVILIISASGINALSYKFDLSSKMILISTIGLSGVAAYLIWIFLITSTMKGEILSYLSKLRTRNILR